MKKHSNYPFEGATRRAELIDPEEIERYTSSDWLEDALIIGFGTVVAVALVIVVLEVFII